MDSQIKSVQNLSNSFVECGFSWKVSKAYRSAGHRRCVLATRAELLLNAQNRIFCHLGDSEFDNGFGWNPDLLLCLGIKTGARLSLLLHQLAEAGQDEFAILFNLLVREGTERIEK